MASLALWLITAGLATLSATTASSILESVTVRGRARRNAARTKRVPVDQVSPGRLVRIVGTVEYATDPLVAPFSARNCAHYEVAVEHQARAGGFRRTLVEARSSSFYVVDETGRALVDTSRSLVDVVVDHFWSARDIDVETRFELERFLFHKGNLGLSHLHDPFALRYTEGVIEEGEVVSVVGVASAERASDTGTGYRDLVRTCVLEAPPRGLVFVSDGLHWA